MTNDPVEVIARAVRDYRPATYDRVPKWHDGVADVVLAALDRAGLGIVPKEPTEAMITAAWAAIVATSDDTVQVAWGSMLAAYGGDDATQQQGSHP